MKKSKPKIIVVLKGGLGNQLFQYSFAKKLSTITNSDLILDTFSGFVFDFKYKRNFELDYLNVPDKKANKLQILILQFIKIQKKYFYKNSNFSKHLFGNYLIDNNNNENIFNLINDLKRNTWVEGYWQSYSLISDYLPSIVNNFKFNSNFNDHIKALAFNMKNENSVAICLRFYEETENPNIQSLTGKFKTFEEINTKIDILRTKLNNPVFYIFSMYKENIYSKLNISDHSFFFITSDNGYNNTIETLWLQSNCKNHIITNSTFYWWGAKLSNFTFQNQTIYIDDTFINTEIYDPNWIKF